MINDDERKAHGRLGAAPLVACPFCGKQETISEQCDIFMQQTFKVHHFCEIAGEIKIGPYHLARWVSEKWNTRAGSAWLGTDTDIVRAIRTLERYAAAGLGVGIEIDGHTGIRCQITDAVNCDGDSIPEAVSNACAAYSALPNDPHDQTGAKTKTI